MPLLADKTITVRNLRYDPETDTEAEITTRLEGCSVHAKTVANATADGLAAASLAQIRIFAGHTLAATQSASEAPVPADGKFPRPCCVGCAERRRCGGCVDTAARRPYRVPGPADDDPCSA